MFAVSCNTALVAVSAVSAIAALAGVFLVSANAVLADESVMYAVSFSAALVAVLAVSTFAALDGVSAISAAFANAALVDTSALSANAAQWYPRHCTELFHLTYFVCGALVICV
jgi:hypothetical protein